MRTSTIAALVALAAGLLAGAGPAAARVPTCAGEVATIVGTPGADVLTGTPGADVIVGLAGDDVLTGKGGDDLLCGGAGSDAITALAGADRVHGGRGDDQIDDVVVRSADQELVGGPGDDTLVFSWRIEEDGEEVPVTVLTDFAAGLAVLGDAGLTFPARSFDTVRARFSAGTWAVVGTDRADHYTTHQYMSVEARTGRGHDVIHGSWHDDDIDGGPGRDTAYASRGRDTCRSIERGPLEACEALS